MYKLTLAMVFCVGMQAVCHPQERNRRRENGRTNVEVKDPAGFQVGQGQQIFSGPQPGEDLPPLEAVGIHGAREGQSYDPVQLNGDQPQLLIFSEAGGVGLRGAFILAGIVEKITKASQVELPIAIVFLTDDPATAARQFAGLARALEDRGSAHVLAGYSPEGRDGPGAYGLDRNVAQTLILAKDGQVTHNFVFPQGMLYPDPYVLGAIAELIGRDRQTVADWLSVPTVEGGRTEAREMQKGTTQPSDPPIASGPRGLRSKLGELVQAGKLTRQEAAMLYRTAFPEPPSREAEPDPAESQP